MTLVSRASQRSVRARDRIRQHYPRILISVVGEATYADSTSRTASRKEKNVARNNAGTNVLRYNETETNNDDETSSSQISVPPPKISKECVSNVHFRPTCNNVHEAAMDDALIDESLRSIHFGGTRNVWRAYESSDADEKAPSPSYALKTLRWKRSFVEQTYRLQEKEAIALDHLSSASGIVGIHGFCGTTLQSEYANRDTLSAFLKKSSGRANQVLPVQLLQIAWRLAQGVANMHAERSGEGNLRIIHRDLDAIKYYADKK